MKKFFFFACVAAMTFSLVSCNKNENKGGNETDSNDPSNIAKENLVAYMPFDGDGTEKIANLTPKAEKVTFTTGRRGKGLQGAEGGYLLYDLPESSAIRTLKAYTVAFWLKQAAIPYEQAPVPMYFCITSKDDHTWGNVSISGDRLDAAADSLSFKNTFRKDGVSWKNQFVTVTKPSFVAGKWNHYVVEYDNVKSAFRMYVNGVCPLDDEKDAGIINRYESEENVPLGDLKPLNPEQIIIGGWLPKAVDSATDEWMGSFTGNMDELRVYDRALTASEVKALYDAEIEMLD